MSDQTTQPKKKKEMLTSFSIILILLAVVALVTIGVSFVTPDVQAATLGNVLMAPVEGFGDAVSVCLFVLVLGGFLAMVNKTDALTNGISLLVHKMGDNELKLIPILMFLFSILGSTYGFCEETVGFYALLAATMMAAGFDALTGAAMILLGAGVGTLGSTVNPFAVGVAISALKDMGIEVSQAVVLPLGVALWIAAYIIAVIFVIAYAKKVKADPSATLMTESELAAAKATYGNASEAVKEKVSLTGKQKSVLVLFAFAFAVMIIGFVPWEDLGFKGFNAGYQEAEVTQEVTAGDVIKQYKKDHLGKLTFDIDNNEIVGSVKTTEQTTAAWSAFLTGVPLGQWYFNEATTWFLLLAIIIGIVAGFDEREIVETFLAGCGDMVSVVMIIALARGVSVLMSSTGLSDYVLNAAASTLKGTPAGVFAPLSYIIYFFMSFLIPSSSGLATVSMPIMGPLAQSLGFNPAVMVQIFSSANGVMNLFTPTSGAIMGGLALARVEWATWIKFAWKLIALIALACIVICTVSMMVL